MYGQHDAAAGGSIELGEHDPREIDRLLEGLGLGEGIDRELVVPNRHLSVRAGAVEVWGPIQDPIFAELLEKAGTALSFDLDTPFADLEPAGQRALLYGAPDQPLALDDHLSFRYCGVLPTIDETTRSSQRHRKLLRDVPCSACEGSRLRTDSLSLIHI